MNWLWWILIIIAAVIILALIIFNVRRIILYSQRSRQARQSIKRAESTVSDLEKKLKSGLDEDREDISKKP